MKQYKIKNRNDLLSKGFECFTESGTYEKQILDENDTDLRVCLFSTVDEDDTKTRPEDYTFNFGIWCDSRTEYILNIDVLFDIKQDLLKEGIIEEVEVEGLKAKLENAIIFKFKKGQEVWYIFDDDGEIKPIIEKGIIGYYDYNDYEIPTIEYFISDDGTRDTVHCYIDEKYVFSTKEEAEQKLRELKGESNGK